MSAPYASRTRRAISALFLAGRSRDAVRLTVALVAVALRVQVVVKADDYPRPQIMYNGGPKRGV
jgi:hypothetical protein